MQFKNMKHLSAANRISQRLPMVGKPAFRFHTAHVVKSMFFGLWAPNRQFLSLPKRERIPTTSSPPRILIFCLLSLHASAGKGMLALLCALANSRTVMFPTSAVWPTLYYILS